MNFRLTMLQIAQKIGIARRMLSMLGVIALVFAGACDQKQFDGVNDTDTPEMDTKNVDSTPPKATTRFGDDIIDVDGRSVFLDSDGRASIHALEPITWGTEDRGDVSDGGGEAISRSGGSMSDGAAPPMVMSTTEASSSLSGGSGESDMGGMTAPPPADFAGDTIAPYPHLEKQASARILTAGIFDDHLNKAYYDNFIGEFLSGIVSDQFPQPMPRPMPGSVPHDPVDDLTSAGVSDDQDVASQLPPIPFRDTRNAVTIVAQSEGGAPLSRAQVEVIDASQEISFVVQTGTDGRALFVPGVDTASTNLAELSVRVSAPKAGKPEEAVSTMLTMDGENRSETVVVTVDGAETALPNMLDLAFIVDATGSMGDELAFIVQEIEEIASQVNKQFGDVDAKFGLIVYRDKGDVYVTRGYGFSELQDFQSFVGKQSADGGGDYPEAMQTALVEAAENLPWREGNVARVAFLLADAPPHDEDVAEAFRGVDALRAKGVRLYPVASSGVRGMAEYVMRSAAYLTQGRYVFLTDDSGVGNSHAEPHVPCYQVALLQDQMISVLSAELTGTLPTLDDKQIVRTVPGGDNPHTILSNGVCLPGQDQPKVPDQSANH